MHIYALKVTAQTALASLCEEVVPACLRRTGLVQDCVWLMLRIG